MWLMWLDIVWHDLVTWPDINTPVFLSEWVLVCPGLERVLPLPQHDLQCEDGEILPQDDVSINTIVILWYSPQCWQPGFHTKHNMRAMYEYRTWATVMSGKCSSTTPSTPLMLHSCFMWTVVVFTCPVCQLCHVKETPVTWNIWDISRKNTLRHIVLLWITSWLLLLLLLLLLLTLRQIWIKYI